MGPNDEVDHTQPVHITITDGKPSTVSVKRYLVNIAWQAANNVEWDDLVLEICENRHGEQHGARCPLRSKRKLPPMEGVAEQGDCKRPHDQLAKQRAATWKDQLIAAGKSEAEADARVAVDRENPNYNDFHSWCGDFATWVFWKAWVLKNKPEDKVTKAELGKIFNREALNGAWRPQANLNAIEAYSRGMSLDDFEAYYASEASLKKRGRTRPKLQPGDPSKLITFHTVKQSGGKVVVDGGYTPQPGDYWMSSRGNGGHIGVVASFTPNGDDAEIITLDGKSFDKEWSSQGAQGLARSRRMLSNLIDDPTDPKKEGKRKIPDFKGFIETAKLRTALGYL